MIVLLTIILIALAIFSRRLRKLCGATLFVIGALLSLTFIGAIFGMPILFIGILIYLKGKKELQ